MASESGTTSCGVRVRPFPGSEDALASLDAHPGRSHSNPALDAVFDAIARVRHDLVAASAALSSPDEPVAEMPSTEPLAGGARAILAEVADRLDGAAASLADLKSRLAAEAEGLSHNPRDAAADGGIADALGRLGGLVAAAEDDSRRLAAELGDHRARLAAIAVAAATADDAALPMAGVAPVEAAIGRAARAGRVALLVIGLDRLARLDRRHGPDTVEEVLRAAARAVSTSFAEIGSVHRLREDVFAVVLAGMPLRQAVAVGEHLRRMMVGKLLVRRSSGEELGRLTLSAGATALRPGDTPTALIDRAELCLGEAQWAGGNRLVCETDPDFDARRIA
jgi:diguanylate cyclase